jgi:hypothetical protein
MRKAINYVLGISTMPSDDHSSNKMDNKSHFQKGRFTGRRDENMVYMPVPASWLRNQNS